MCFYNIVLKNYICRGDEFRTEFSKIGELRSLIPTSVNIMALTATATSEVLKVVTERLSLDNPLIIGLSPSQSHIFYNAEKLPDIANYCRELSAKLKIKRLSFPKMLIFCRSYADWYNVPYFRSTDGTTLH